MAGKVRPECAFPAVRLGGGDPGERVCSPLTRGLMTYPDTLMTFSTPVTLSLALAIALSKCSFPLM